MTPTEMTPAEITPAEITDVAYAQAVEAGRLAAANEFRAHNVSYLRDRDAIEIITVANGGFVVPRALVGALRIVAVEDLAAMALWPDGSVIEIESQDIHISVHGLLTAALTVLVPGRILAGMFAAHGGTKTSPAKASSSRQNGKRGERPKKQAA